MFKLFVLVLSATIAYASITGYIGPSDKPRLLSVLTQALTKLNTDSLSSVYYGAKGFILLNEQIPKNLVVDACKHIKQNFKSDATPESAFYGVAAWNLLNCGNEAQLGVKNIHTEATVKALKDVLDQGKSIVDIRYAIEALKTIGQSIPNPQKIAQSLQALLIRDDNLQNIGHAFHAAHHLGAAGKFIAQREEEVVVQADEVDGRLLQWEGGLTMTSLLLTGLFKQPATKAITQPQADKFAAYLLTRKTVQSPKGVVALLEAAQALAASSVSPVSITHADHNPITADNPQMTIRISNLLGEPLKPAPTPIVAQSATRVTDDVVVLSKQPLTAGSDPIEYVLPLRIEPGQYRIGFTAGSHSVAFTKRVLGDVQLNWLEVGVVDSDDSSEPRMMKLQPPTRLLQPLEADGSQRLVIRFALTRAVHQPFVRLSSGKREIVFVAEQDSNKAYKVDVNLAVELPYAATFEMELIVGDFIMSNPTIWSFGAIDVKLAAGEPAPALALKGPRPEIEHMFRVPEKRPPQVVSMLFTGLAIAPLLLLIVLWSRIGFSLGNFSLPAFAFHGGLASIFSLFTCFWLKLDMFTTCGWLLPLGAFTFLAGHRVLSTLARQRSTKH